MADNDQNDEYKLEEFDSYENTPSEQSDYDLNESPAPEQMPTPPKNDVRRNALIVVGIVLFLMLLYKLLGGLISGKKPQETAKEIIPVAPVVQVPTQPQIPVQIPQPVPAPSELKQKISDIESKQDSVQSQIASMNNQVSDVNNNVSNLSTQIANLNQTLTNLTAQLNRQSDEINVLMQRTKPKPVKQIARSRKVSQAISYYINAVIPGRAWLIGSNGSTLTVREGSNVPGYGVVKLIDPLEGRILTSSGKTIRFSQNDS